MRVPLADGKTLPKDAKGRRRDGMRRRALLLAGAMSSLAGCAQNVMLSNAGKAAKNLVFGYPDLDVRREAIAKLPYASMAARVGRGPEVMLLLGRVDGRVQHWISTDRSVLVTRGGRVVKTTGFPENLKDSLVAGVDPLADGAHRLVAPVSYLRSLDLDRERHFGLLLDCTLEVVEPQTIDIVELQFETLLLRERNVARHVNWSFENLYWLDIGDGFVWQSHQHIARSFPPVTTKVLKPPG
ncbi:MAG: YjbF family lipoprotein [Alphaproteobacteria bacterium]|nr:YjbF family lipoprotein [Alphaproteobacteria bacterium]